MFGFPKFHFKKALLFVEEAGDVTCPVFHPRRPRLRRCRRHHGRHCRRRHSNIFCPFEKAADVSSPSSSARAAVKVAATASGGGGGIVSLVSLEREKGKLFLVLLPPLV